MNVNLQNFCLFFIMFMDLLFCMLWDYRIRVIKIFFWFFVNFLFIVVKIEWKFVVENNLYVDCVLYF